MYPDLDLSLVYAEYALGHTQTCLSRFTASVSSQMSSYNLPQQLPIHVLSGLLMCRVLSYCDERILEWPM